MAGNAQSFLRGDVNIDGILDITDPIASLSFQFLGTFNPPCLDAADFDDNGFIDIADAIAELDFLFLGDAQPAAPWPACGVDPSPETPRLDCARYPERHCEPPRGGAIFEFLDVLSFEVASRCCLPGAGASWQSASMCVDFGGEDRSLLDGSPPCDTPPPSEGDVLRFLRPPPVSVVLPEVTVAVSLPPLRVNDRSLTLDLYRLVENGRVGPVRVAERALSIVAEGLDPVDGVRVLEFRLATSEVFDVFRAEHVLVATLWRQRTDGALVDVDVEHLALPADFNPLLIAAASIESHPFRVNATRVDLPTPGEEISLLGSGLAGDPALAMLQSALLSTGEAARRAEEDISSPELDRLRREFEDLVEEKAGVAAEAEQSEAEAAAAADERRDLESQLSDLELINRVLEGRYGPGWQDLLRDLVGRREELASGNDVDNAAQMGQVREEKVARRDELDDTIARKEEELRNLRAREPSLRTQIEEAYQNARGKAGNHKASLEIGDGGVSYEISGIFLGANNRVIYHEPSGQSYRDAKEALEALIEEFEELWEKIRECERLLEELRRESQWVAENIARVEAEQAELEEIDEVLDSWFGSEGELPDGLPFLSDILARLERDGHGDLAELLRRLFGRAPRSLQELEDWIRQLEAFLEEKHAREDALADALADAVRREQDAAGRASDAKDRCEELEGEIDSKEDEVDQARRDAIAEHEAALAEARRKAAEEERRRREEEQVEKEIREVLDRIDEIGDEAFQELLEKTGLGLLDELFPDFKLGTVIGGFMTIKDMPECVCEILEAMQALFASRHGEELATANEVIRRWRECAGLDFISSAEIGSEQLARAVSRMTREQRAAAGAAINRAVSREECR